MNISSLILACRNIKKGEAAKAAIVEEAGCKGRTTVEVWELDLANYQSVQAFGQRVRSQLPCLDGFIANAGVEMTQFELAEGLEVTLTVNVISTILLAIEVLPKLKESSKKNGGPTTLTIVGSMVHALAPDEQLEEPSTDMDTFEALSDPKTSDMPMRYNLSKLMVHQCCAELAQRVSSSEVIVNWVNPGWCATELARFKDPPMSQRMLFAIMGRTAEQGSRTLVHAVLAGKESHGCYLSECQIKPQSTFMRSERGLLIQKRLWKELMARIEGTSSKMASFTQ
jgi:NAD(P)-dependent dehydrogenase (short-subunit alcohol dehydrogenase family)